MVQVSPIQIDMTRLLADRHDSVVVNLPAAELENFGVYGLNATPTGYKWAVRSPGVARDGAGARVPVLAVRPAGDAPEKLLFPLLVGMALEAGFAFREQGLQRTLQRLVVVYDPNETGPVWHFGVCAVLK